MKTEISQKKSKIVLLICFIAEIAGLVGFLIFSLGVNQNTVTENSHISIYLYSLAMAILIIIMLSFLIRSHLTSGNYYFAILGTFVFFSLICELLVRLVYLKPEFADLIFAAETAAWILDAVSLLLASLFLTHSFDLDGVAIKKTWINIVRILMLVTIIFVVVNVPTHFAFYVSDAGKYIENTGASLVLVSLEAITIFNFFIVFKMKTDLNERIMQFIYILIPFLTYYIQDNLDAIFSYYLVLFISYIFGYSNIIVSREKDIAVTDAINESRQKELDMAAEIQLNMLPKDFNFHNKEGLDLYAKMTPAREVGGDFYDCFSIDENRIAVVIADVSGKGIPASLFMSVGKTMINKGLREGKSVSDVFTSVHRIMVESNNRKMFVTAFAAIIDTNENMMTYCNAGHCLPLLMKGGSSYEFVNDRHGPMLGCMIAKNHTYTESKTDFVEGDALYIYTDGVDEAHNINGELFGKDRLLETINKDVGLSASDTIEFVEKNVQDFAGKQVQFDDITMLCLKRKKYNMEATENKQSITTNVSVGTMEDVKVFLTDFSEVNNIPQKINNRILLINDEIYSNILKFSGAKEAIVSAEIRDKIICVTYQDDGIEYNPLEAVSFDPSLPIDKRPVGKMGIFITKKLAKDVKYCRENNKNKLEIMIELS